MKKLRLHLRLAALPATFLPGQKPVPDRLEQRFAVEKSDAQKPERLGQMAGGVFDAVQYGLIGCIQTFAALRDLYVAQSRKAAKV